MVLWMSNVVWVVYSSGFQRKTHDWANENWNVDIIKAIDRYTFSEGWLQNFKEPAAEGYIQVEHSSD